MSVIFGKRPGYSLIILYVSKMLMICLDAIQRISVQILHITTFFNAHGGVEKSVTDICNGLAGKYAVEVLCTTTGEPGRRQHGAVSVCSTGGFINVSGRPVSASFCKQIARYAVDVA